MIELKNVPGEKETLDSLINAKATPSHPCSPYLFLFRWNRGKVSRKGGGNKTLQTAEKKQME